MTYQLPTQDELSLLRAVAKRRRRAARPLRDELRRAMRRLGLRPTHDPLLLEGEVPGVIAYVDHPAVGLIRVGRFATADGWACKTFAVIRSHRSAASLEEAIRLSVQTALPAPGTTFRSVSEHGNPIDVLVETSPSTTGWVDYTWTDSGGAKHEAMAPWETLLRWYNKARREAAPAPTTTDLF